jgi:uncharacterized protein (DUF433 family)
MRIEDIVSRDPEVVHGALVFAGTRVPVRILIEHLEAGDPMSEFLRGFPTVGPRQAREYLRLAERLMEYHVGEEPVEERIVPVSKSLQRRKRDSEPGVSPPGREAETKDHARTA